MCSGGENLHHQNRRAQLVADPLLLGGMVLAQAQWTTMRASLTAYCAGTSTIMPQASNSQDYGEQDCYRPTNSAPEQDSEIVSCRWSTS